MGLDLRGIVREVDEELQRERERLAAERDHYRKMLIRYGVHDQTCELWKGIGKGGRPCSCGLDAALQGEE